MLQRRHQLGNLPNFPFSHGSENIQKNNRNRHSPKRNIYDKWWSLMSICLLFTSSQKKISPSISHLVFTFSARQWLLIFNQKFHTAKEFKLKKTKKRCRLRSSHAGAHRYTTITTALTDSRSFSFQKFQLPLFSFLIYWETTTTRNNKAPSLSIAVNHLHDDVTILFPWGQNWRRIQSTFSRAEYNKNN